MTPKGLAVTGDPKRASCHRGFLYRKFKKKLLEIFGRPFDDFINTLLRFFFRIRDMLEHGILESRILETRVTDIGARMPLTHLRLTFAIPLSHFTYILASRCSVDRTRSKLVLATIAATEHNAIFQA